MIDTSQRRPQRVVHYRFGDAHEVLRVEDIAPTPSPGAKEVRVRVVRSIIHPGDLQLVAARFSTAHAEIPEGRVPGSEAVGVVEDAASGALDGMDIKIGDRVAFLAQGAWQAEVVLPVHALVAIPDDISDDVATQILVNTITARHVLRTGLKSLGGAPSCVVLTAAASAVGKLIAEQALRHDLRLIRLVRSADSAARLEDLLPGGDILSTATPRWRNAIRDAANGDVPLVIDGVGGAMIAEIGQLLTAGGTVVSFGLLDGGPADLTQFVPKALTLRGVTLGTWRTDTTADERAPDIATAVDIARKKPQVFGDVRAFDLSELVTAITAVSAPGKSGNVIIRF